MSVLDALTAGLSDDDVEMVVADSDDPDNAGNAAAPHTGFGSSNIAPPSEGVDDSDKTAAIKKRKKKRKAKTARGGSGSGGRGGKHKFKKDNKFNWKLDELTEDLDPEDFAYPLSRMLRERNMLLLTKIVENIGNPTAIALVQVTQKIQKEGGMDVPEVNKKRGKNADKDQKRTSGGVFIKLVRDEIPETMWKKINADVKAEIKAKQDKFKAQSRVTADGQPILCRDDDDEDD